MSERLSLIISSEMNDEIEKLQEILHMDKSSVIRQLLSKSIKELKKEKALEEYQKGKVSFGKAAEIADLNLWEFIDVCRKNNIQLNLSEEDARLGISKVKELDVNDYKKRAEDLGSFNE
jgi:predicted HTH domain antitoxin